AAATGAEQAITAGGTLKIEAEADSRTLGERVGQGARVTLGATTIEQAGSIDLPGGVLTFQASGSNPDAVAIRFGAGSSTSVAGYTVSGPDGFEAFGSAGSVTARARQGRVEVLGSLDASAARRSDGSPGRGDGGSIALQAYGAGGALSFSEQR